MFAVSMSFVFGLLLLCVLIPTWIGKCFGNRRRNRHADIQERLNALNEEDIADVEVDLHQGLLDGVDGRRRARRNRTDQQR